MKKIISLILTISAVMVASFYLAYAWFTVANEVSDTVTVSVEAPEGISITTSAITNNTLVPINGSNGAVQDENGQPTTAYYGATYTITSPYSSGTLKFDGVEAEGELGKAVRVQTTYSSTGKLFSTSGAAVSYKYGASTVTPDKSGSLGAIYNKGTVYVKVFLEGNDPACVAENYQENISVKLKFSIEEEQ